MEENNLGYKIYCYVCLINQKKYVGQTCQTLEERAGKDGIRYIRKNGAFGNAIKKYGWDMFGVITIEDNLSLEQANEREQYWIKELNTISPNGYNLDSGGRNQKRHPDSIQKFSEKRRGHSVPDEDRRKISKTLGGRRVLEYDFSGRIINQWETLFEAARALGVQSKLLSAYCSGKKHFHQGRYFEYEGLKSEIERSKILSSVGKKLLWYNNGEINTRAYECPEGFKPGRLYKDN